jgi:hypothetical protein
MGNQILLLTIFIIAVAIFAGYIHVSTNNSPNSPVSGCEAVGIIKEYSVEKGIGNSQYDITLKDGRQITLVGDEPEIANGALVEKCIGEYNIVPAQSGGQFNNIPYPQSSPSYEKWS